jgi:hypothetical protein
MAKLSNRSFRVGSAAILLNQAYATGSVGRQPIAAEGRIKFIVGMGMPTDSLNSAVLRGQRPFFFNWAIGKYPKTTPIVNVGQFFCQCFFAHQGG